jgi:peptidoglycan/LPS O-acetylase OafA/YrhL
MLAITTASALASWHLYEKHFLALKSKFQAAPVDKAAAPDSQARLAELAAEGQGSI